MRRTMICVALAMLLTACATTSAPTAMRTGLGATPPAVTYQPAAPGSCHVRGPLPDPICTPGAVQEGVTAAVICAPGYTTRNVRPPASYTNALKIQQLKEYGLALTPADVEEDHLIPLELAGNPVSPFNLWPQNRHLALGLSAADKDSVENAAHKAVCENKMTLAEAQQAIATDWVALRGELTQMGYAAVSNPNAPIPPEP